MSTRDATTMPLSDETRAGSTVVPSPSTSLRPTDVRYSVIEEAGRGGMGVVIRAYDRRLAREVALKAIIPERLNAEARARIVAEARAMALLSHPNVVAVYDVDVDEHQVTLAMEYVHGVTLKRWLAMGPRPWHAIVELFAQAGRGLAAAHAAGLLHRDFKPANVLVGEDGRVRVTDFGIACPCTPATSGSDDDGTSSRSPADRTSQSATVAGTPKYMAPEQHRGETLDATADQYAFCLALWEALCGEAPFVVGNTVRPEDKEAGPPAWPTAIRVPRSIVEALKRGLAPLPADRWPSMDALLIALTRRPVHRVRAWLAGAAALSACTAVGVAVTSWRELQAQQCSSALAHVEEAWSPRTREHVRDALRQTGVAYADAAWGHVRSTLDAYANAWVAQHEEACLATTVRGEQPEAVMDLRMACLHRAKTTLGAVADVLAHADAAVVEKTHELVAQLPALDHCTDIAALTSDVPPPAPHEASAVAELRTRLARAKAERIAGKYDKALAAMQALEHAVAALDYPLLRVEVLLELGRAYDDGGAYARAEEVWRDALSTALRERYTQRAGLAATELAHLAGVRQAHPDKGHAFAAVGRGLLASADEATEAAFLSSLAGIYKKEGRLDEAATQLRAAIALREQRLGPGHAELAVLRSRLAQVLEVQGLHAEAEAELRAVLDLELRALGSSHPSVAVTRGHLATTLYSQGRYREAEAEHRQALAGILEAHGSAHPFVGAERNNLARALAGQGRHAEAEAEYRAAAELFAERLGPDHPDVAIAHNNIGQALEAQGKAAQAEHEYRTALELFTARLGPRHIYVAFAQTNLGNALYRQKRFEEAERVHRDAIALWEQLVGPEHPNLATARSSLASTLTSLRKYAEAEAEFRAAIALLEKAAPDHPHIGVFHNDLALAYAAQGRHARAEAETRAALAHWERVLAPDHPYFAQARTNLGDSLLARGQLEAAAGQYRAALDLRERTLRADDPMLAKARHDLGCVLAELGKPRDALPLLERAWSVRKRDASAQASAAETAHALADVLEALGECERARALVHDARAALAQHDAGGAAELDALERRLEAHHCASEHREL